MKKQIKHQKALLFLCISLLSLVIFGPYMFGEQAYIVGWDMRTIYCSNFENLRTVLQDFVQNGTKPYWTWYSFLGNDFYSSKLFYFNDFFEWPFALTNIRYDHAIMIMTYIKFLIAGFSFNAYARYNKFSDFTSLIGSLMFTFSCYHMYVMPHPFFASFFVFFPLYFLGVDRYIIEKKYGLFLFMVFFQFLNNYYQLYSLSLFTIIYFIWRWKKEYGTYKNMMKQAVRLIGYYMIGMMLSGIVLIPEILNILSNSRVGQRSSTWVYRSLVPYLDYLVGMFIPASALANRGTPISSLYTHVTANNSVMNAYWWATSIPALLFPQLFTKKNRTRLNCLIVFLVSLIALVPILSSMMHGFSEPSFRWLASPLFLLIAAVLDLVEEPERINRKLLLGTMIILVVAQMTATPIIAFLTNADFTALKSDLWLCFIFVPTLLIIGCSLYRKNTRVLFAGVMVELALVSYLSFFGSPDLSNLSKTDYERISARMGEKDEYNRFTMTLEEGNETCFYRNYIDPQSVYWGLSTSYNLDFNIQGLICYDSTYLPSMNDLILLDPEHIQDYLPWTFNITNSDVMNLLSTKYAVVMDESEVPFHNFTYVSNYYDMQVYRNDDYINLGQTYTSVITYDEYDPSMSSVVTETVIAHAEDEEEIKSLLGSEIIAFETVAKDGNYLFADITTNEPGFAVLSVPYDKGWHVAVNGSPIKVYKVNGGLMGIALPEGYAAVEMTFSPHGLKAGALMSACGIILLVVVTVLHRRKK